MFTGDLYLYIAIYYHEFAKKLLIHKYYKNIFSVEK